MEATHRKPPGTARQRVLAMTLALLAAVVVLAAFAALAPREALSQTAAVDDQTDSGTIDTPGCDGQEVTVKHRELRALQRINEYRASKSLRLYCLDVSLQKLSQSHASDMAARNFYSSTTPEGKTSGQRLSDAGYGCYPQGAMNIGAYKPRVSSAGVLQSWTNLDGPRNNIVNPNHLRIGIGSANDPEFGEWYFENASYGEYVQYAVNFAGNECMNTSAPVISEVSPASGAAVNDTTPVFSAHVTDMQTNLYERNLAVYMDGVKMAATRYDYNAGTDVLTGTSPRLARGGHILKIVADDRDGKVSKKSSNFSVRR